MPSISSPICSPPTGLAVISLNNNINNNNKMSQPSLLNNISQKPQFSNNNNNNHKSGGYIDPTPNKHQQQPFPNSRNSVINPLSSNFQADRKPEVCFFFVLFIFLLQTQTDRLIFFYRLTIIKFVFR
jgi:hypothetical protein